MPGINSSYGGGGQSLTTDGGLGGLSGGGGGLDVDFFKQMALRKMAQQDEDRQRRIGEENKMIANRDHPLAGLDQGDQHMKEMRQRDELLQMQARQHAAPTKMISGAQIIPGEVLDPMAMNAYQRQAFLPQGSNMSGDINAQSATSQVRDTGPMSTMYSPSSIAQKAHDDGDNSRADWGGLASYGRYQSDDDERRKKQQG